MDNLNNENLQEVITDDSHMIEEMLFGAKRKSNLSLAEQAIRGDYYVKGEPVKGHYITDDERYILVEKKIDDENLELKKRLAQESALNSSLQKQIIENGKSISDMNRASSVQEAIKKYGDEIFAYFMKERKAKIIEQLRPEIENAAIQKYLATHKKTFPHLQKANQERSDECIYRTALYLLDFCGGKSPKEIAQKHEVAYATVYRLIKINDRSDIARLMEVYTLHKDLFECFSEENVRNCLESSLSKKSERLEKKLAAAREFIAKNTLEDSGDDWGE